MPLIITDTPTRPFEKCALDIVDHLTVTTNGNKYILTFQDNLTKLTSKPTQLSLADFFVTWYTYTTLKNI